jgi:hypothetical protein
MEWYQNIMWISNAYALVCSGNIGTTDGDIHWGHTFPGLVHDNNEMLRVQSEVTCKAKLRFHSS